MHADDTQPTQAQAQAPAVADLIERPAHAQIDHWRVLRVLGRGGMGEVLLAERSEGDFRQEVARKVLRWGTVDDALRDRLRRERRLLSALEHPNIARLLDGGDLPNGDPYLVLEFVRGEPITRACEGLDLRRTLELFLKACEAVEYAHQRLIVHRDIKPANILVDAAGVPKLLDFGIAKLIAGAEGGDSEMTRAGLGLMTPAYSAPEQLRGEAITVATDVYQLGLLLHELLCGERAQPVQDTTRPSEIERLVCEREPTPPSQGGALSPTARRALRGDLDTIVLRALAKAPERRYASVAALAADLRAHLDRRPIAARSDSVSYRASRFLYRHRVASLVGVAMLALLLGLLWRELSLRGEAERARDEARQQAARAEAALVEAREGRARAEAIAAFVEGMLVRAGTQRVGGGPEARIVDALAPAWTQAGALFDTAPDQYASLAVVIARVHGSLGQYRQAYDLLAEAWQRLQGVLPEAHERMIDLRRTLAAHASASGLMEVALEHREAVYRLETSVNGAGSETALSALSSLADTLHALGRGAQTLELYDAALAEAQARLPADSDAVLDLRLHQAVALSTLGQTGRARQSLMDLVDLRLARGQHDHADLVSSFLQIAISLDREGRLGQSLQALRWLDELLVAVHGPEYRSRFAGLNNQVVVLATLEQREAERALLGELQPRIRQAFGEDHPLMRRLLLSDARLRLRQGDAAGARALVAPLFERLAEQLGDGAWQTLQVESQLRLSECLLQPKAETLARLQRIASLADSVAPRGSSLQFANNEIRHAGIECAFASGQRRQAIEDMQALRDELIASSGRYDYDARRSLSSLVAMARSVGDAALERESEALLELPDDDPTAAAWVSKLPAPAALTGDG